MEIKETHGVGNRSAAAPYLVRNFLLFHSKLIPQSRVTLRFFDWIKVAPLQILNQRKLEDFQVGRLANNHRHFGEPNFLSGPPPAFARDQFVGAAIHPADDQRLDNPVLPDRIDQFPKSFFAKILARLQGARNDTGQPHFVNLLGDFGLLPNGSGLSGLAARVGGWCEGTRPDQGAEAFAESRLRHVSEAIESISTTQIAIKSQPMLRRPWSRLACDDAPRPRHYYARTFSGSGRRVYVLCNRQEQNRSARVSF